MFLLKISSLVALFTGNLFIPNCFFEIKLRIKLFLSESTKVNRRLMSTQKANFTINRLIFDFEIQHYEAKNKSINYFFNDSLSWIMLHAIVFGKNNIPLQSGAISNGSQRAIE
jgi:hypothetical protein